MKALTRFALTAAASVLISALPGAQSVDAQSVDAQTAITQPTQAKPASAKPTSATATAAEATTTSTTAPESGTAGSKTPDTMTHDTKAPAPPERKHALSLVGKPQFGPDYQHFDWVNPKAPKLGTVRQSVIGSFDSLNQFSVKGDAATGLGLIYDTLMVSSPNEPSTEYGLVAKWISYPKDYSSATFGLRPEARFHDGQPVTPEDIIYTLGAIKKSHPVYGYYYKNVVKAEKTGPFEVTFTFNVTGNRELPLIVSQLPVLPKHYWTGKNDKGEQRDLSKSTLEIPLASGPYKITKVEAGRAIVYERVKDWWAKDLPVAIGQYNFDRINLSYYRDRTPAFEAFKSGDIDYWEENSSQKWATSYDVPPVKKGWIHKKTISLKTPMSMQAFVLNTRRNQFKDARVRRAFNLAFDFEWANKNLFYKQYSRLSSYFQNTELASTGLPKGLELEYLKELRDQIPAEVFTTQYKNPTNTKPEDRRANLAKAKDLLAAAGWKLQKITIDDPSCGMFCKAMMGIGLRSAKTQETLRNAKGDELKIEFLLVSPLFERIVLPYARTLNLLGIKTAVRKVDAAQYTRRLKGFDFDVVVGNFPQSHSPGNEQRYFWGSASANKNGSRNLIGVHDPAVDKLIDRIIFSKSRKELVAATHALDRVLLWSHYVVPQWFVPYRRLAMWDIFRAPKRQPSQSVAFLRAWWYDSDAAKRIADLQGK